MQRPYRDGGMVTSPTLTRRMLNKVPEVTAYFWVIKVLCTTIGESAADYINETLGFGLQNTTALMSVLLLIALVAQFRLRKYVPAVYWTSVMLISVVGTLVTDNLTDGLNVDLAISTTVFGALLALTFLGWYRSERTLSIHAITTTRREAWYWLTVLVTFALGTAAGDLLTDRLGISLIGAVAIFAVAIAVIFAAHRLLGMGPILSFWIAYILTRPLGGSTGDFLSGARADGGAGLGTLGTSLTFLACIIAVVTYLSITKVDQTERTHPETLLDEPQKTQRPASAGGDAHIPTQPTAHHDAAVDTAKPRTGHSSNDHENPKPSQGG